MTYKQPKALGSKLHRGPAKVALTAAALAFSTAVTGCSQEKREYALPSSFCGINEKKDLYAPIFPPGKSIDQGKITEAIKGAEEHEQCDYYVDGNVEVTVSGIWYDKEQSPQPTLNSLIAEHGQYKPKKVSGKYPAATWPYGAVSLVECPNSEYRANLYSLTIYSSAIKDRDESHRALGDLIQSYTAKVLKKLPCEKETKKRS